MFKWGISATSVTRAMVKMKKKTSPTKAVGYKSSKHKPSGKEKKHVNDSDIREVVFASPTVLQVDHVKSRFIEKTMQRINEERFILKVKELDGMLKNMQRAMLELEKISPDLFLKAMIKPEGQYFPLNRRIAVDSPSPDIWKGANS
jgi:hypothetical protein